LEYQQECHLGHCARDLELVLCGVFRGQVPLALKPDVEN
jgi:hypothetical protein